MASKKYYAAYKGENIVAHGSIEEIAVAIGVKLQTARFMTYETYKQRVRNRKTTGNAMEIIEVEDDE